jgi:hypothetical protein
LRVEVHGIDGAFGFGGGDKDPPDPPAPACADGGRGRAPPAPPAEEEALPPLRRRRCAFIEESFGVAPITATGRGAPSINGRAKPRKRGASRAEAVKRGGLFKWVVQLDDPAKSS